MAELGLSGFSAALGVGLSALGAGLIGSARRLRFAGWIGGLGLALVLGPPLFRAFSVRGTERARLLLLPEAHGTRLINALFPEADGSVVAAHLLSWRGGLPDDEGARFSEILATAYARADGTLPSLATPAIATYLGLQTRGAFDALLIEAETPAPSGAVLFLHGYAGNFNVYCWEIAQAAAQAGLLTLCPSTSAEARWWEPEGDAIFRASVRHLRGRGVERIYLAGLSNGAAGATVIALAHARELAGLIAISGVGAPHAPAISTLVVQGSRDRMMTAGQARAYAAASAHARYVAVAGGHLVFLSRYEQTRAAIARFLREREREARQIPLP